MFLADLLGSQIYLKYYKFHSLLEIVKKWQKVDVSKNFCDVERQ